jgi:hypothetical protein
MTLVVVCFMAWTWLRNQFVVFPTPLACGERYATIARRLVILDLSRIFLADSRVVFWLEAFDKPTSTISKAFVVVVTVESLA